LIFKKLKKEKREREREKEDTQPKIQSLTWGPEEIDPNHSSIDPNLFYNFDWLSNH
jgi:hypothetical protein